MSRLNKWMRLNGKGLGQNESLVQGFKVSDLERVFFFFAFFASFLERLHEERRETRRIFSAYWAPTNQL